MFLHKRIIIMLVLQVGVVVDSSGGVDLIELVDANTIQSQKKGKCQYEIGYHFIYLNLSDLNR
jgi:hypothetical protein